MSDHLSIWPRQGVGADAAKRVTAPCTAHLQLSCVYGDDDRRAASPYKTSSCPALAETKEQGESPSGARVAQAHSDAGKFPKRVLGRKSQSRAHYG
jgi:hypothetical protein